MSITNYKKVVETLNKIKEEDVVSYIVMVETKETNDDGSAKGVNAVEGEGSRLMNLISNIDKELMTGYILTKLFMETKNE